MKKPAINLVVALPPEAKPINRHLGLLRDNRHDRYRLYRNEHICLVISGLGLQHAAAAADWLHSVNDYRQGDIWINLGIAGHPSHPVGEIFQASRIEDKETGQIWHLETKGDLLCPCEQVVSVTKPDTGYDLDALVEMEAAGFYRSVLNHTSPDRIYCLKVVSDNRLNPTAMLNGKTVSRLIRERMDLLDTLLTTIRDNR
jgi:hypothetical protein